MMINIICETWYRNNIITKDIVYKSFKTNGLANKLDYSEDNLFNFWKSMQNEVPLIDGDLENGINYDEKLGY